MADEPEIVAGGIESFSSDGDNAKFKVGSVDDQIKADRYNNRRRRNRCGSIRVVPIRTVR